MSEQSGPMHSPRVVFLDDEELLLGVIRRLLRRRHPDWRVVTTTDPHVVLELTRQAGVDVVVSDLWMPGMNGIEVLSQVAVIRPEVVRILLTGGSGPDPEVMPPGVFHHRLDKPCEHLRLFALIASSCVDRRGDPPGGAG